MMGGFQGGLERGGPGERARSWRCKALKDYRDRGCTLPPQPSPALVQEMMNFMVGERVGDEYVPMMLEELALDGNDSRAPRWSREVPAAVREKFHVLVIGAGMSGLLQALRLKEAGIPFTVVEKNDSVGGTWYENQYPGCRVDIANHFYSYSFEPYPWSEYFSRRDELLDYFRHFVKRHGLEPYIRYNTEVTAARYDEKGSVWDVELKSNTGGAPRTMRVNALVSAVGQLNRPRIPGHRRARELQGHAGALGRLGSELDLRGKRVAVRRLRRQRLPARAGSRQGGRQALRVPALGALDAAEPAVPRSGQPAVPLAGAARALLRALVPLPHLLPGQRRDSAGDPHRQELAAPGARGQRAERPVPLAAHRVHEDARSTATWRCWRR